MSERERKRGSAAHLADRVLEVPVVVLLLVLGQALALVRTRTVLLGLVLARDGVDLHAIDLLDAHGAALQEMFGESAHVRARRQHAGTEKEKGKGEGAP